MPLFNVAHIYPLVRISLSDRQKDAIIYLDNQDWSIEIERTMIHLRSSGSSRTVEYCIRAIASLKQFYCLYLIAPDDPHIISEELDHFWHSHIENSRRYKIMCETIGQYIHHNPIDHERHLRMKSWLIDYKRTREKLCEIFGDKNIDPILFPDSQKSTFDDYFSEDSG